MLKYLCFFLFLSSNMCLAQESASRNISGFSSIDSTTIKYLEEIQLSNGDTPLQLLKNKPNFSSHYEIVEWNCGLPCRQAAIINLKDGKISATLTYCYSLDFKLNSAVIVADKNEGDIFCKVKYYEIKNNRLEEILPEEN